MAKDRLTRLQSLYDLTLTKLEEAMGQSAPNITVDGVSVDRMGYIRELQSQLKAYADMPGVVPEVKPIFTVIGVAR